MRETHSKAKPLISWSERDRERSGQASSVLKFLQWPSSPYNIHPSTHGTLEAFNQISAYYFDHGTCKKIEI